MNDSVIICDESIKEIASTNFNENKATCKTVKHNISIFYTHFFFFF